MSKEMPEISIVATNGCNYANKCGMAKFLAQKGKIEPDGSINCGKTDPNDCSRNPSNPGSWLDLGTPLPSTHEELRTAYPNGRYG